MACLRLADAWLGLVNVSRFGAVVRGVVRKVRAGHGEYSWLGVASNRRGLVSFGLARWGVVRHG
jgi:hypothetical protein